MRVRHQPTMLNTSPQFPRIRVITLRHPINIKHLTTRPRPRPPAPADRGRYSQSVPAPPRPAGSPGHWRLLFLFESGVRGKLQHRASERRCCGRLLRAAPPSSRLRRFSAQPINLLLCTELNEDFVFVLARWLSVKIVFFV